MPTIAEAFAPDHLMGLVELYDKPYYDQSPYTQMFEAGVKDVQDGDEPKIDRLLHDRHLEGFNPLLASPVMLTRMSFEQRRYAWVDVHYAVDIPLEQISKELRFPGDITPNGMKWIRTEAKNFVKKFRRAKELYAAQVLHARNGFICNTNTVPGTKMSFTWDFGTQDLDVTSGNDFELPGSPIWSIELERMRDKMLDNSGSSLRHLFGNSTHMKWFRGNSEMKDWLQGTQSSVSVFHSGNMFAGGEVQDLTFHQLDHKYRRSGGSTDYRYNTPMDTNGAAETETIVGLPEQAMWKDIFCHLRNPIIVPKTGIIMANAQTGEGAYDYEMKPGPILYAVFYPAPPTIRLVFADRYFLGLLVPEAVLNFLPT